MEEWKDEGTGVSQRIGKGEIDEGDEEEGDREVEITRIKEKIAIENDRKHGPTSLIYESKQTSITIPIIITPINKHSGAYNRVETSRPLSDP